MKKHLITMALSLTLGISIFPSLLNKTVSQKDSNETSATNEVSLPQGYVQLEYVGFPAGSYLETNVQFSVDKGRVKFNYEGSLTDFSFGYERDDHCIYPAGGELNIGYYYNRRTLGTGLNNPTSEITLFDLSFDSKNASLTFGEESYSTAYVDSVITKGTFKFGKATGSHPGSFEGKLYNMEIEYNGELVRNYIPCRESSTKTVGFYDLINNTFSASSSSLYPFYYGDAKAISYIGNNGIQIFPTDKKVLELDCEADFSNLTDKLIAEKDTILKGTVSGESLLVGTDTLDLTKIFGNDMAAGVAYQMTVQNDKIDDIYTIIKSDNNSRLYITGSLSFKELTDNKNAYCSGNISLLSGNTTIETGLAKIKGRGNTFYPGSKDSFNIKLEKSKALILGANAQKHYSLIGLNNHNMDHMLNQIGYTMYQQLCQSTDAIKYRMVDLYYNDRCLGFYMLTEKIRIDEEVINITEPDMTEGSDGRTVNAGTVNKSKEEDDLLKLGISRFTYAPSANVKHDGGFVIEAGYYANSNYSFVTRRGIPWEMKDPEGISLSQMTKVAGYMQRVEDALFSDSGVNSYGEHYSELLDLDSLARDFLVRAFTTDLDLYVTSNFLYIDGNDNGLIGKMRAGCVWDLDYFDLSHNGLYERNPNGSYEFLDKLMQKGDFISCLYAINENEFSSIIANIINPNFTLYPNVYSLVNDYQVARNADAALWNRTYNSAWYINAFINRASVWNAIWSSDNALCGVNIVKNGETLVANSIGASGWQWYEVDATDYSMKAIDGETKAVLNEPEEGKLYSVAVTGTPLRSVSLTATQTSAPYEFGKATVSFNMKGQGSQIADIQVDEGSTISKPQKPYSSGYMFKGWYKETELVNKWNFSADVVTEDVILYAKWIQDSSVFTGTSISLCDNTWINMYTALSDDDYNDYKFTYTLRDETTEHSIDSSLLKKIDGKWRISVILLPYQLADVVTIRMYDLSDRLISYKADSVRAYGKRLLDNSKSQAEKDAMQALLDYGAAVQKLKGYHTDDLANDFSKLPA